VVDIVERVLVKCVVVVGDVVDEVFVVVVVVVVEYFGIDFGVNRDMSFLSDKQNM
jgi:hypothetical protein